MTSVLFLVQRVGGGTNTFAVEDATATAVQDEIKTLTEDMIDGHVQSFVVDATNWRPSESTTSNTT